MANLKDTKALAVRAANELQHGRKAQALGILTFAIATALSLKSKYRSILVADLRLAYAKVALMRVTEPIKTPSLNIATLERGE